MHDCVVHAFLIVSFHFVSVSLFFLFFCFYTHSHTHSHRKPSSHLIAFPFFLRRDLWLGECWRQAITMSCLNSSVRQSGRGGSGDIRGPLPRHTPLLHASLALAHVNPAPVAAPSPTLPCFSSALGSGSVLTEPTYALLFFSLFLSPHVTGCEAASALHRIRCLLHKSESLCCTPSVQWNKCAGFCLGDLDTEILWHFYLVTVHFGRRWARVQQDIKPFSDFFLCCLCNFIILFVCLFFSFIHSEIYSQNW